MTEDQERAKNLRTVFEQHWLHARHVENERLWFTNIYALVVGGLLASMWMKAAATSCSPWPWQILVVILLLSLLGLGMCHSLIIPFLRHRTLAQVIQLKEWGLPYTDEYKLEGYRKVYKGGVSKYEIVCTRRSAKFVSLSKVFHLFYIFMSAFSLGLIVYSVTNKSWGAIIAGVVSLALLLAFYKCCLKPIEDKAIKEINDEFDISKINDEKKALTKCLPILQLVKLVFRGN